MKMQDFDEAIFKCVIICKGNFFSFEDMAFNFGAEIMQII